MSGAIERLTGKLARSPSIAEIAEELKTTPEEVLEAMEVGSRLLHGLALDGTERGGGARPDRDDRARTTRASSAPRTARRSSPRSTGCPSASARSCGCASRKGSPQTQIAEAVGLSQMHVSRLIRKSLAEMREELT